MRPIPNPFLHCSHLFPRGTSFLFFLLLWLSSMLHDSPQTARATDWLLDASAYTSNAVKQNHEIVLSNGLVERTWRLAPNAACVGFENLMTGESILRSIRPEASVTINGVTLAVGGLRGQPNHAFYFDNWLADMKSDPEAMRYTGYEISTPKERMAWKQIRHHAPDAVWPPKGVSLRLDFKPAQDEFRGITVSVHYELYDGVPVFSKWLSVTNATKNPITIDRFTNEILAVVEHGNPVELRDGVSLPKPESLHVETDMAFGGFMHINACRLAVHWVPDPEFHTQVNYQKMQPCLLEVRPSIGPDQDVAPNETFESFRTFELVYDTTERGRRGLALRRMYRTIAPWITENPLMMHMRDSNPDKVKQAIDQCVDVGFEMLILSFGSGFNMENDDPEYLRMWNDVAAYAKSRDIEIGGYSLLSSRRITPDGDNIHHPDTLQPGGQIFGYSPALTSNWGRTYFKKLYNFFPKTGFTLLEHDGSYPGDIDALARPPLQKSMENSQWAQWRMISNFYKWCREQGIYLNVPDYYYLAGSSKCGMGYRETNWSLPRAQQVLHTRQNIYDGTWEKTPSMGWMFVPLTQYHGGGAAATVEPLHEHLDHYEMMMACNLGAGVQACYRGPRLYDTEKTKEAVQKWVEWYKQHRNILESDIIHESSRRATGRDLDWLLHANPALHEKGLLVVYNPLDTAIKRTLPLRLYYTGLTEKALVTHEGKEENAYTLDRDYRINLPVQIPAKKMTWFTIQ
jgi:hypothetical protein